MAAKDTIKPESPTEQLARELFATTAQHLADEFVAAATAAVAAIREPEQPQADLEPLSNLYRQERMRHYLDQLVETHRRYGHPFSIAIFDIEGPGTRNGADGQAAEAPEIVGEALRDSIRLVDEAFHLEENAFCVLAPYQDTVGGVQMTNRLHRKLNELEAAGGLKIGVAAGVVACPEHSTDAEDLLRKADEAMWRARAVGQPVGVGVLQDR
ncbi:MAG TPA: diguanylate cyclase [Solirubrobacterales bacterium]